MKHTAFPVLAAGLALAVSTAAVAQDKKPVVLDWLTYKPQAAGDPQSITTQWFADQVKLRTNGEVEIRIHWSGSVSKINEIPTALQNGVGQIGDVVTPYFPDKLLVNNAISFFIPQPLSPVELGQKMIDWTHKHPQFAQELAKYNLKVVGWRPLESYGMICTKPVKSAEDMKGKRVRSFGFALPALFEAMGATPVSMGTPETYEALERGIIDCSPVGVTLARGWKYDEVAKYFIDIPLGATWGHLITMNLDAHKKLSKSAQAIIEGIGKEYLVEYTMYQNLLEEEVRAQWKKDMGVTIVPFKREDLVKASGSEKVQKVRAEWISRAKRTGLPAEEIAAQLKFD